MIGKWHLGWDWHKTGNEIDFTKPVKNGPDINGFDQYYGHCGSLDMPPYVWVDTGRITAQPDRVEGVTKRKIAYGWYRKGPIGSDFKIPEVLPHLFDKSIEHVQCTQRRRQDRASRSFSTWPCPRRTRPIVPVPPFKDASGLNPYADFVMQVDHHMGQLLDAVKEPGSTTTRWSSSPATTAARRKRTFDCLEEQGAPSERGTTGATRRTSTRVGTAFRSSSVGPGEIEGGTHDQALACLTDVYATLEAITGQERQARRRRGRLQLAAGVRRCGDFGSRHVDQPLHRRLVRDSPGALEAVSIRRQRRLECTA